MSAKSSLQDPKAMKLLSRVGDDIAELREDMHKLFSHTAHQTIPNGANEIADRTKARLSAGSAYAASQLRTLKELENSRRSAELLGGAILLGALGYGIYAFMKRKSYNKQEFTDYHEDSSTLD